jgi:hypothetical protein
MTVLMYLAGGRRQETREGSRGNPVPHITRLLFIPFFLFLFFCCNQTLNPQHKTHQKIVSQISFLFQESGKFKKNSKGNRSLQ